MHQLMAFDITRKQWPNYYFKEKFSSKGKTMVVGDTDTIYAFNWRTVVAMQHSTFGGIQMRMAMLPFMQALSPIWKGLDINSGFQLQTPCWFEERTQEDLVHFGCLDICFVQNRFKYSIAGLKEATLHEDENLIPLYKNVSSVSLKL